MYFRRLINSILMFERRFYSVVRIWGMLLILESLMIFLSLGVDMLYEAKAFKPLLNSGLITLSLGLFLWVPIKKIDISVDRKLGFFIVATVWLILSAFGALPFWLGGYSPTYTDAFFETISGFTTTGASIFPSVEILPKGILFFRSIIAWLGGIGMVVIMIAFIPFFGGSGMSLFSAEVAGPSKSKITPKLKQTASLLLRVYLILTLLAILSFYFAGMNFFDSVCHSFCALASAGFSTKDTSISGFSPLIQYIAIIFMFFAGTNFTLFILLLRKEFRKVIRNEELRVYIGIILIFSLLIALFIYNNDIGIEASIRHALFQVISIMTTTGFATFDYTIWNIPAYFLIFILMFIGAMSGSTSGGLKVVRIIVLFKNARKITYEGLHKNAFNPVRIDSKIIEDKVILNVLTVFLLFIITYILSVFLLVLFNTPILEAIGSAIAALSNVGPGLGISGGFGNYSNYSIESKWILSFLMYVGRLELITVYALLFRSFWRK